MPMSHHPSYIPCSSLFILSLFLILLTAPIDSSFTFLHTILLPGHHVIPHPCRHPMISIVPAILSGERPIPFLAFFIMH
ncbi:hypothetical protein BKA57DRAFT_465221 [Linnemannia elongata]|nr:hypothetical protein BKA57DRAFT_465221 [Linnemannia elongata]